MALMACVDCGTQVSTEAAACPKCGRRRSVNVRWGWVAIVVCGLFAALLLAAAVKARDTRDSRPVPVRVTEALTTPAGIAQKRVDQAESTWDEFDRLPDTMRSIAMARAYVLKSSQLAEGIDEPWATQIQDEALASGRRRVARMLGGDTEGDRADVFVLASDPAACVARKPQFKAGAAHVEVLRDWGFRVLRCPGSAAWDVP